MHITTARRMGKLHLYDTIRLNTPTKKRTRSLSAIRKDLKKTERINKM